MISKIIVFGFVSITFIASILILIFLSKSQKGVERDLEKDRKRARNLTYAILVVSMLTAILFAIFKDDNLYKVLDVYDKGVGVRCLTDDEHETTVLPIDSNKITKIKEYDLIDSSGNVIISGIWFNSEADETLENSQP